MPTLDVSELNVIIAVLGGFIVLYGIISVKIKQIWYLGEALPALMVGIVLGPIAAKFIDSERWGSAVKDQTSEITLVIGSLVTSTDPVLSQAIAKGPFADKYVPRALREVISAEAGANDGFGFPFLLLATYLIRHTPEEDVNFKPSIAEAATNGAHRLMARAGDVGRLGGGAGKAVEIWIVEGWLYFILVGAITGAVCGVISMYAVNYSLKRKWIDTESLLLYPTALGLFVIGITGCAGLDDLLACFCAGAALNWNGRYLDETLQRHDEVNGSIDILLNLGGFAYLGAVIPWSDFHDPDGTGVTIGRLLALGLLVLLLRRIPAMMAMYRFMPNTVKSWREALFMGYFGPIGIGAAFYVEHARHLYPKLDAAETHEEEDLLRAMGPVVYFLILFSIVVHGLSIPALELIYRWQKVEPIVEMEPVTERRFSISSPLPNNAHIDHRHGNIVRHNRFSHAASRNGGMSFENIERRYGKSEHGSTSRPHPDTPTWRLTSATDGSEETLKVEDAQFAREKTSIQFIDGNPMRERQRSEDMGMPPNIGRIDYSAQARI
ncbi:Sodium/hydrogen exchanger family-domain-containing protein [Ampelomyces quisqualis]|uniref:Sodium/hydrogen exchanger family-domain-containing protein n=1 Tax=Ampelomyces quisqualis TaxID=50730 RepID=A0A6A5QQ12_AMPQU|nr:Sodium/hydrogen exchanger family-domain-containing protein [Ampelomyces quisqualis]